MSWPGYLVLALTGLILGQVLWVKLASAGLGGRPIDELATVFPDLLSHRGRAVIYCYSEHCAPWRRLDPSVAALADQHARLYRLDLGAHPQAVQALGVRATPTTLLVEYGRVVKSSWATPGARSRRFWRNEGRAPPDRRSTPAAAARVQFARWHPADTSPATGRSLSFHDLQAFPRSKVAAARPAARSGGATRRDP